MLPLSVTEKTILHLEKYQPGWKWTVTMVKKGDKMVSALVKSRVDE